MKRRGRGEKEMRERDGRGGRVMEEEGEGWKKRESDGRGGRGMEEEGEGWKRRERDGRGGRGMEGEEFKHFCQHKCECEMLWAHRYMEACISVLNIEEILKNQKIIIKHIII